MSKIDELLAKLDLPEDSPEQYGWMLSTIREHKACCPADLAFRLRDEVDATKFLEGQRKVYLARHYQKEYWDEYEKTTTFAESERWFGSQESKQIDWIIAALIAKELAKQ